MPSTTSAGPDIGPRHLIEPLDQAVEALGIVHQLTGIVRGGTHGRRQQRAQGRPHVRQERRQRPMRVRQQARRHAKPPPGQRSGDPACGIGPPRTPERWEAMASLTARVSTGLMVAITTDSSGGGASPASVAPNPR